jgi:hypothetical protein
MKRWGDNPHRFFVLCVAHTVPKHIIYNKLSYLKGL